MVAPRMKYIEHVLNKCIMDKSNENGRVSNLSIHFTSVQGQKDLELVVSYRLEKIIDNYVGDGGSRGVY